MSVIPALKRLRRENRCKFKASIDYVERPYLKKPNEQTADLGWGRSLAIVATLNACGHGDRSLTGSAPEEKSNNLE